MPVGKSQVVIMAASVALSIKEEIDFRQRHPAARKKWMLEPPKAANLWHQTGTGRLLWLAEAPCFSYTAKRRR